MSSTAQNNLSQDRINYQRVAKAISFLDDRYQTQPDLDTIAKHVGVSKFHLQRLFSSWAGVSPKQFLQFLTKEHAKKKLLENSVIDAATDCGLSSGSRLHDLFITYESVTPGEYKSQGKGLEIQYGVQDSPFGFCLIATTHRGICKLSFFDNKNASTGAINELEREWAGATVSENQPASAEIADTIFGNYNNQEGSMRLLLKGSPFQLKVWEALLSIPEGEIWSYQKVAQALGKPSGVRAVASAIAKNNVGYLIPCHRVIRSTGALSNYRWGVERKAAMIAREQSQTLQP